VSPFHFLLERDSNFDLFVLVLSVSAGSIWVDVDNSTILIGTLPKNTSSYYSPGLMEMASNMAWVENYLNLTNGYYKVTSSEGDQFEYLVPFPPGYTSTMKAQWTTDVIVLDPSCSWQTAMTNGTMIDDSYQYVMLRESNLGVGLPSNRLLGMFLLSSKDFICLLDFSIKPSDCQCHTGSMVRV
jgi:hypothetical protein